MHRIKKEYAAALMLLMMTSFAVPSAADTLPAADLQKPCSLQISLEDKSRTEPESGAEITLYHVADLQFTGESYIYSYTEAFADCACPLDEPDSPALAGALYTYAAENSISGTAALTDDMGQVTFSGLQAGLYLAAETKTPPGYSSFIPFLTALPVTEDGEIKYDLTARPKMGDIEETYLAVRKIWNDDGKDRPQSITVELLKNEKPVETVTLSEENRWRYAWKVLAKDEDWDVREINIPKGYTVSYEQNSVGFTIRNTPTLIQTGQLKWPVPVLAGSGTLLILIGTALCVSGRNRRDEK